MERLHSRTYTPFPKSECNYSDGYGGSWVHISGKETERTRTESIIYRGIN